MTATFLFTDIEASSRLWERHGHAMRAAVLGHEDLSREVIGRFGGLLVKDTGDGVFAAFADPCSAVSAAAELQRQLVSTVWPEVGPLRVRMAVHTGRAECREGDYHGATVNRAARLMGLAHGGQVLVSGAVRALVVDDLPELLELLDLGEHRLRDLSRPERVFQLCSPDLPRDHPPLRSVDVLPGNVPPQLTSFVGRSVDVERVAAAIAADRLLTLTGAGGVGKTRLAIHVAGELLLDYPDGAWLCELAPVHDLEGVYQVFAAALGVERRGGLSLEESVLSFLADRHVLVVVDNCEHVLRDAGALIERLLHRAPGVRVLATSREPLGVEGERVWPVRSLEVPDDGADVHAVAGAAAVRLFVDRAAAVRSDFALSEANANAVAEICRRLDGIPLALELAAGRILAMSPREIAGHLDERFRLLTGGRRGALERHQTLRSMVDWSYSLLPENERAVFDRLSVFAGGFDSEAAQAVATGDGIEHWDVVDAVAALVAKSMLAVTERGDGTTRFQMLETLRQYARERLGEGADPDRWRRRHAQYFAALADRLHVQFKGPDLAMARRAFREELDNFRSAVMWSLDAGESCVELGMQIIAAFAVEVANDPTTGVETWAEQALVHVDAVPRSLGARVMGIAGFAALASGDLAACAQLADRALALVPADDVVSRHTALVARTVAAMYSHNPEEALATARHPVLPGLDETYPFEYSLIATTRAFAASQMLGRAAGRAHAEEGVAYASRCGSPTALASAHVALALSFLDEDPERALEALDVAFRNFGGGNTTIPSALHAAAEALAQLHDPHALVRLREAVEFTHRTRWRWNMVVNLRVAALVFSSLGMVDASAVAIGACESEHWPKLLLPSDVELLTKLKESVRARLGAGRFDERLALGRGMSYDQVLAFMRESTPLPESDWALESQA